MKREDLTDAIGGIDMDILEESQKLRKNRRNKASLWPAAAAAAVFLLAASVLLLVIKNNAVSSQPESSTANTETKTEAFESAQDKETETKDQSGQPDETHENEAEDTGDAENEVKSAGENDPQALIISLTPDVNAGDRRMLYADDRYQICRAGSEYGGPQSFILLKNEGSAWKAAFHITSEKRTMSDCADELKAAARDFWQYYKTIYPVTEEWISRAEDYLREHYIAVQYDPAHADPEETFSEEERQMLRDHVIFSYAADMTEVFVPDWIAWEFGVGYGYLSFVQPLFVMKMVCPETEDPVLTRLIIKDIGDGTEKYYGMSAYVTWEGTAHDRIFRVTQAVDHFFDEMSTGGQWLSGTGDTSKSKTWDTNLTVNLINLRTVGHNASGLETVRCEEEKIKANIYVTNKAEGYTSCSLIILADGAPVRFSIDGESYDSYHMYAAGDLMLQAELEPEFDLHIGRLDFYLLSDHKKQNRMNGMGSVQWTCLVEQEEEAVMPEALHETVKTRPATSSSSFSGFGTWAWIWEAEDEDREYTNVGPDSINYHPGDDLILEAVAGEPGYYRTVLICDGKYADATENGQKITCIDWRKTEEDMLQLTFQLREMKKQEEIFMVITTDLSRGREDQHTFIYFPTWLVYSE